MKYDVLGEELIVDPLRWGYADMSNVEVTAKLHALDTGRTRPRGNVTGDEVFVQTDASEFAELSEHKQQLWLAFCGRETIDSGHGSNVAFIKWIFGAESKTVANLAAIRLEPISRAQELGLGKVKPGHVERGRNPQAMAQLKQKRQIRDKEAADAQ